MAGERFKEITDLYYMECGDFMLSPQGDIADTSLDHYRGFLQRVDTRMSSAKGDWPLESSIGVGLSDFLGKRNTLETSKAIQSRIYSALFQEDLLRANELVVDVLPISDTKVAIAVIIQPPGEAGRVVRLYTYDTRDNKSFIRSL